MAERSPIPREKEMSHLSFMVNMASGMVRGRVRPTNDDVAQHGVHTPEISRPRHAALVTSLTLEIHFMANINSCQTKMLADQYHMTISRTQL